MRIGSFGSWQDYRQKSQNRWSSTKRSPNTSITAIGENDRVENAIKEHIEMMAERGINIEQLINEKHL